MVDIQNGKIEDYISGKQVNATPEEVNAVQVYSRILVEDYGYSPQQIATHPQFRVRVNPSDEEYKYPVDIAVFKNGKKDRDDVQIIVECKKPTREDGIQQLKHYLEFSKAELGVWFNGESTHYIRKYFKDGQIAFDENAIDIPKCGQRYEDIGLFKKRDLQPTHNLKSTFISIRNYLAGNAVGTTRDEELARQIINIVLCKLYDEKNTSMDDIVQFRAGIDESPDDVKKRIVQRFEQTRQSYPDVLDETDQITLDAQSLTYVVGQLQRYSLMKAQRDVVGDAFEVFIHRALKGGQGQYFTPKNVVRAAIQILAPGIDDRIIDPACGSGGFLIESLKYIYDLIDEKGKANGWTPADIIREKVEKASLNFCGIEKDQFLSKVVKAYMILMGDGRSGIFCEDSLDAPTEWHQKTQSRVSIGGFQVLLANPPFGAKIPVKGESKLKQFSLGYKWQYDKKANVWVKTSKVKDDEAPQILFINRCLDLVEEGGRLALVLPDGVISNPTYGYIVQDLLSKAELIGLIDLPMSTFLPYTPTKTHLVLLKKTSEPRKDYYFCMGYAKTCGHDKRGREIMSDEISQIPDLWRKLEPGKKDAYSHLGWMMNIKDVKDNILLPKFYNPDLDKELQAYEASGNFEIKTLGGLQEEGVLRVSRGNEIGSEYYGTGSVPFVRTSEISNWEITSDCTHCVAEDIYELYKDKQNIEVEDILVVNDGTYLMGRAAMVTESDLKIIFQSHFRRIKVLRKDILSPYLLLALLGLEIVQKQIEAKAIRQGTISTLGNRLMEVKIPIPVNQEQTRQITTDVEKIIKEKNEAKKKAQSYSINGKSETLMGIRNKAKIGNL